MTSQSDFDEVRLIEGSRGVFLRSSALSESILDAVRHGDLAIVDEVDEIVYGTA